MHVPLHRLAAACALPIVLAIAPSARADEPRFDQSRVDPSPEFAALREDHLHRQQAILGYLTGAAALSLAGGTALLFTDPPGFRDKPKAFRTSFAAFALVYGALNAAFVAANFAGLDRQRETLLNAPLLQQDRLRQARAFGGNAGLDMLYITLGVTLWSADTRPLVQGMGASIALQGAFLLGFDGAGNLVMRH